jgi:cyclase
MHTQKDRSTVIWRGLLLLACIVPLLAFQGPAPPGAQYEGEAFTFQKVRNDLYLAVGTGSLTLISNAAVIVNKDDVVIVDTHTSPAGAWALIRELKRITSKPVRTVINTHYHLDHVHGNQIFSPDVEIIGHELTREMILAGKSKSGPAYANVVGSLPSQIATLQQTIEKAADAKSRTDLERQLAIRKNFLAATDAVVPTPPNTTMSERMTLFRGGREIRLYCFGRGHSVADVVVYLPEEKVLITGDLLQQTVPFMGESFPQDWIQTLERVKGLDFDTVMPGHGQTFAGKGAAGQLQSYLKDIWEQSAKLHGAGVGAGEAAKQIDLRSHAGDYPTLLIIKGVGAPPAQVARIYELLDQRKAADGR